MNIVAWISYFISGLNALNWGLFVFLNFNPIDYVLSVTGGDAYRKLVYGITFFAGFYAILSLFR